MGRERPRLNSFSLCAARFRLSQLCGPAPLAVQLARPARAAMPFAPISLDEMNKEVLAWDIYQMLAGGPLYDVKKVPVRFTSIDQYLDIFEPLLLEECRAQILRSMGESEPAPHHLKLLSIEQNEPFRLMRFQPPPPPEGGKPHFFETDIVLVSYEPLDMDAAAKRGDGEDEDEPSTGGDFHALGLVASGGGSEHLSIKLHLPSQRTARMPQAQFKRLSMLHRVMVPSSGHWCVREAVQRAAGEGRRVVTAPPRRSGTCRSWATW